MSYFTDNPLLQKPGKKIFPVVHVADQKQAERNTALALGSGADGVFLISHDAYYNVLGSVYEHVRDAFPDAFIGLNFLDMSALKAYQFVLQLPSVSALWTDDSGVNDEGCTTDALRLARAMEKNQWPGLYFASVAFKGQAAVDNVASAAINASESCHVVTTSGPATGYAAATSKLARMKQALGNRPLAVASGYSIDNAASQLKHLDMVLVASSVSRDEHNFDEPKLRELVEFTHGF